MRPARSTDEFLADPIGRYLSGERWLYACFDRELFAQVYWGRPEERDVERLATLWQCELGAAPPHDSFIDASRLEGVEPASFSVLHQHLDCNRAALERCVRRQAIVRPAGLVGAVVAGFYQVLKPAYPVRVFASASAALGWLGCASVEASLDELSMAATGQDPLVRRLRERLEADPTDAELPSVARALGLSTRTLQRRLREAGTTFVGEVGRARVAAAQALLADSQRKLTAVALEVGCASLQHFSALFRRVTGMTPQPMARLPHPRGQEAPVKIGLTIPKIGLTIAIQLDFSRRAR